MSDLVSAAQRIRGQRNSVHHLDCELTMTAGFNGPCTCGWADALPLVADLLAAIAEHDEANDQHEWETCFIDVRGRADALASAILHTDQHDGEE